MKRSSKITLAIFASSLIASNAMALTHSTLPELNKIESVTYHGSFDGSGGAGNQNNGNGNGSGNGTDGDGNGSFNQ